MKHNRTILRLKDKVRLDTDETYTGIVTRIKGNVVWIDGNITGFTVDRWVKL